MGYFNAAELQAMAQAQVVPPAITAEMLAYCRWRYALTGISILYSVIALLALLQSGILSQLRSFVLHLSNRKLFQVPLFYFLLALLLMLIRLPLSFFSGYYLEHAFALSDQALIAWCADLLKARAVDIFVIALCLTLAFAIIDRFPQRWPYILWAAITPLIAAGIFLAPLLVDPLFNQFSPMAPGELRSRIAHIAERAGIKDAPIFIVDKSRQTNKINAYVTGLGSSARIVIWDNTINLLPPDQVEAIVAHEAGHYALKHVFTGFILTTAGLLLLFLLVRNFANKLIKRLPSQWHVTSLTDVSIIPVILLFATLFSFLLAPVENAISRTMEREADAFGLALTGDGPAMARAFVTLSNQNLAEPSPPKLIQFWFFSHPTLKERIMTALKRD